MIILFPSESSYMIASLCFTCTMNSLMIKFGERTILTKSNQINLSVSRTFTIWRKSNYDCFYVIFLVRQSFFPLKLTYVSSVFTIWCISNYDCFMWFLLWGNLFSCSPYRLLVTHQESLRSTFNKTHVITDMRYSLIQQNTDRVMSSGHGMMK